MDLKLYMKQQPRYDVHGNDVYIAGKPSRLEIKPGKLPAARQWNNYNKYIEVTDQVSDLTKLKLTWTLERDEEGVKVAGESNIAKAASGNLTFEGEAYKLIRAWLVDDISAPVNVIDVKIEHVGCGDYEHWTIRAGDIEWCEDDICVFDVTLKQKDDSLDCIRRTMITDNHQGWFGNGRTPADPNKKHPRFSYCNEIRPNGILIVQWYFMTQLMSIMGPILLTVVIPVLKIINKIAQTINKIIRDINRILGANINEVNEQPVPDEDDIYDVVGNYFVESAGCGREHPAPLIRDYISNVCSKCDIHVSAATAPIFFSETLRIQTSVDWDKQEPAKIRYNPHYNACYLAPVSAKGIRRYDALSFFKGAKKNTNEWWLPDNSPLLTLDEFLDELKQLYNAEWRLVDGKLYFFRKDEWLYDSPVLDFSKNGRDRAKLIEGLCFSWDELKDPAIIKGLYTTDAADTLGNEAMGQMNGYVSNGNTDIHPNIEGVMDKTTQFGATRFRLDGAGNDYVLDAMQQVINSTIFSGHLWTGAIFDTVDRYFVDYGDYALLIKQETTTLPKVLLWDGNYIHHEGQVLPMNAKCVKPYYAHTSRGQTTPPINVRYNNYPTSMMWEHKHEPQAKVLGQQLVPPKAPPGYYQVSGPSLGGIIVQQGARLVNYYMYFEPGYINTMWDWFHWIDDPLANPQLHKRFTAKMELCCATLNELYPFGDGKGIALGQKVKLPIDNTLEGKLTEVEVNYNTNDTDGQYIQIKGTV